MPATRKLAVSACYEAAERPETVASQPASQPATEEGPWRSQSSSLMVPKTTSGQSMHSRIFWCADDAMDDALRWPVACTGPLRASWPGHKKGGVEQEYKINKRVLADSLSTADRDP